MSEDALPKLVAAHPLLFRGEAPAWSHLPAGWYDLAHKLCRDLEVLLGDQAHRWMAREGKEKFGSWRLYWRIDGIAEPLFSDLLGIGTADSNLGPRRGDEPGTVVNLARTPAGIRLTIIADDELSLAVHECVRKSEVESERTCLYCGSPGTLWTDGRLHTACMHHRRQNAMTLEKWARATALKRRGRQGMRGKDGK